MQGSEDQLTLWIERLSQGESQAAAVIWTAYFEKLVRYAGQRLGNFPRRMADEEDVALSAMQSFCHGMQAGAFPDVKGRDDLWRLLLTITARKACRHIKEQTRQKRGGGRVRGESVFDKSPNTDFQDGIAAVLGAEPTPDLAAMFAEQCQSLLDKLDEPLLRQIAILRLEGHSTAEIAIKCDCATRTVERKLERIRRIWDRTVGRHET